MPSIITVPRIVRALKKVPEKRFRIMDLAAELVDEKGIVDVPRAMDAQGELNLAIIEVESYIRATKDIARVLQGIEGPRLEQNGNGEEDDLVEVDEE